MTSTTVPYFLYSAGILFREGLEALLVIIALAAGVRNAGDSGKTRSIYLGALFAVGASLVLAWLVYDLIGDNASDALEGVFQIFAAATLFYVSSWLTSKGQAQQWNHFILARIDSAERSAMPSIAIGLTAFLAVMREGAETIVFFQALIAGATETAEKHAVAAGIAIAAAGLIVTFAALRKVAARIPIGALFSTTSILLYALAVVFVGQGVASFQEAGVVGTTFVTHVPAISVLGLYPTVQGLIAQGALLIFAAVAIIRPRGAAGPVGISGQPALAPVRDRTPCNRFAAGPDQNPFNFRGYFLSGEKRLVAEPEAFRHRGVVAEARPRTAQNLAQIVTGLLQSLVACLHDRELRALRVQFKRERLVALGLRQAGQRLMNHGARAARRRVGLIGAGNSNLFGAQRGDRQESDGERCQYRCGGARPQPQSARCRPPSQPSDRVRHLRDRLSSASPTSASRR